MEDLEGLEDLVCFLALTPKWVVRFLALTPKCDPGVVPGWGWVELEVTGDLLAAIGAAAIRYVVGNNREVVTSDYDT